MNDNNRLGALLVFKDGVSLAEAAEALRKIKHLLDLPEVGYEPVRFEKNGQPCVRYEERPLQVKDVVKKFNPEHGSPVWYIP